MICDGTERNKDDLEWVSAPSLEPLSLAPQHETALTPLCDDHYPTTEYGAGADR